jgi:hypothetical protein
MRQDNIIEKRIRLVRELWRLTQRQFVQQLRYAS